MMRASPFRAASPAFGLRVMPYASQSAYVAMRKAYSLPSDPRKRVTPFSSRCDAIK